MKTNEIHVAELLPIQEAPKRSMPDREAWIISGPETSDSGVILEQDRS